MEERKHFTGVCIYETECTASIPVIAKDKESALEAVKNEFEEWNAQWVKMGGNPKKLKEIRVK